MDFQLSAEQEAVRDLARDVFAREWPASRLREAWEGKPRDRSLWRALGETGILGLAVPEERGGSGGDLVDLVPVLEEAGRAAVADPVAEHAAIAAIVLSAHGGELAAAWLSRIASGEAVVTAGSNRNWLVPDADIADLALIEWDGALHAVPGHVGRNPSATEDRSRRLFVLPEPQAETVLSDGAAAASAARRVGAIATAAFLDGISLRLLEMTVDHVKARRQFGRPIGSFQAVKHKLATVHTQLEAARAAVLYAAYAASNDAADADVAASVAKLAANEASSLANAEALQCHGGIGFTWEHDLHLWLKRGLALRAAWGTSAEHRARLAPAAFAEKEEREG